MDINNISPGIKEILDGLSEKDKVYLHNDFGKNFELCKDENEHVQSILNISKEKIAKFEEQAMIKRGGSGVYNKKEH